MAAHTEKEETYKNWPTDKKVEAVQKEMAPFFIYAAIPIIITIIIALVFGPSLA